MSELINNRDNRAAMHWKLLTGVSALALTAYISSADVAKAEDADRPVLWMEFGGQLDGIGDPAQTWTPPNEPAPLAQPAFEPFGRMPLIGYDANSKISFQPAGSDWIYSASIQYGKAKRGPTDTHDQGNPTGYNLFGLPAPATYAFTDSRAVSDVKHLILDFQAGKDIGLGLMGGHGSSNVAVGIRVAHFADNAHGTMTAQVSAHYKYNAGVNRSANLRAARNFDGVGPSIDWNASLPLAGSLSDGLALDWGANAALLFGRQKANVSLQTKNVRFSTPFTGTGTSYLLTHSTVRLIRKKQVIVPNFGGFAGLSYRMDGDAKISFGYKADFFFGAIDGGIATAKKENRGFFGPFASISIGIGD